MSRRTDFLGSWHELENSIKLHMDSSFKTGIGIDLDELKKKYLLQTEKWTIRTYYEGQWLKGIGDEKFADEFLGLMRTIDFKISAPTKKKPIELIGGVVIAALILFIMKLSPVALVLSALVIAGGAVAYVKGSKALRAGYNKTVRKEIVDTLQRKGEELAALCDKVDGK
ncbi:MAG: hypothetical protein J1F63_01440 [Oscillospiraceae bacterium]|nr:hypothetical protein [Oscillospiraceae bacterium]